MYQSQCRTQIRPHSVKSLLRGSQCSLGCGIKAYVRKTWDRNTRYPTSNLDSGILVVISIWRANTSTGGVDFVESMNQSSVPLESLTALDVNTFMDSISTALSIGLDANLSREIFSKTECNDKDNSFC